MIRIAHRHLDVVAALPRPGIPMLVVALLWASAASGQPAQPAPGQAGRDADGSSALVRRVEERFDVLPLRDGLALRPKAATPGVRSIEVTGGAIAIDGTPVTGAELRARLSGEAADVVLELSYLDATEQRVLFGASAASSQPAADAADAPDARDGRRIFRRARRNNRNDRVNVGGSVSVAAGEVVQGDAVAVGGSATIDGEVQGDVVAIGGGIRLGPKAIVGNDVVSIGGGVQRDPGAQIGGEVVEIGWGNLPAEWFSAPGWLSGRWRRGVSSTFALVATFTRVAFLCLFAALVVMLAGNYVDRVGGHASTGPIKAGAIGFLAQLLFLPVLIVTIIVLVATIIGIPLLIGIPFLILGLFIVALLGFTAVAHRIGRRVCGRFGWEPASMVRQTMIGILTVLSPLLLARVLGLVGVPFFLTGSLAMLGVLAEYAVWTIGFGAVALARFQRPVTSTLAVPSVQV